MYHYNHYEPTSVDHLTELHGTRQEAVGGLMGRFATREDEVDDLFRLGVFVDLYRVVRQGVQAGVESYSIKRLEPLCGYRRQVDLREATASLIAFEAALEDGTAAGDAGRQTGRGRVQRGRLPGHPGLAGLAGGAAADLAERTGEQLPRPFVDEEPAAHRGSRGHPDQVRAAGWRPGRNGRADGGAAARALLADLLDWHRREDKPAWWRYFYVRTLSPAELIGEPDALGGLTGGEIVDQVKRSVVRRFSFPPQEHRFSAGDTARRPETGQAGRSGRWTMRPGRST